MKKKISVQFCLVGILAIILTVFFVSFSYYQVFKDQAVEELRVFCDFLIEENVPGHEADLKGETLKGRIRITEINAEGTVVYDSEANPYNMDNHAGREEVKKALNQGEGVAYRDSKTVDRTTIYYARKVESGNVLRVGMEINGMIYLIKNSFPIIVFVVLGLIVVFVGVSYYLTRQILAPIEKVAENMDNIHKDDVYDELKPFASKIRSQNKMRAEFTANVSHELKTPLTSIVGYAQLIESGIAKGGDVQEFAGKINQESNRLLALINDIMKLSRLDENNGEKALERVDLLKIAKKCAKRLELNASEKTIAFTVVGEDLEVSGAPSMIEEMIYNLCDNSIRYSNPGGLLIVSIYKREENAVVSVKDNGIGIPLKHQEHIFERFYRVDKSHSKATGGTGLGLSIVKHIALYHNARIELDSQPGQGTEIRVIFPEILEK